MPGKKERDHWWAFLAGKPDSEWNPPPRRNKPSAKFGGMRGFGSPADFEVDTSHGSEDIHVERHDVHIITEDAVQDSLSPREPATHLIQSIDEVCTSLNLTVIVNTIFQRLAFHLLMYFTHWINEHLSKPDLSFDPTESHARWIFALVTRIDDHISADDMNLLRNLARAVIALLKSCKQEELVGASEVILDQVGSERMSVRSCWIILTIVIDVWKQHDLWLDAEHAVRSVKPGVAAAPSMQGYTT